MAEHLYILEDMSATENKPVLSTHLADGRFLHFVKRNDWEFVERPGVTGIVVMVGLTSHGGMILVSQWREPVNSWVIELPAGLVGDGPDGGQESLKAAARRELLEETGFEATTLYPFLSGPPSPGISNEVVTFFRVRGLRRVNPGGGVENERVRAHVVPFAGLMEWLESMQQRGYLVDPKVFTGAYFLRAELDGYI